MVNSRIIAITIGFLGFCITYAFAKQVQKDSGLELDEKYVNVVSMLFGIIGFVTTFTIIFNCLSNSDTAKEATTTTEIVSEETVSNEITAEESSIEETIVEETQEITKSAEEDPVIIKYQRYAYAEYLNDMEPGDLLDLDIADRSKLLVGTDTETAETFWNTETSEYKDFYEIYYSELE